MRPHFLLITTVVAAVVVVEQVRSECSSGCRDIDVEDYYCDSVCNNAACGYDGGDCVSSDTCYGFESCAECVLKSGCSFADDGDLKVGCVSSSILNGFFSGVSGTNDCSTIESNPQGAESLNLNDDRLIFQRYYLDAIEVGPVWSKNITGKNVLIHFCDTALDIGTSNSLIHTPRISTTPIVHNP
jgi:hypothetical protein